MKRLLLILCCFLLLLTACGAEENKISEDYEEIATEQLHLLWDVHFETFDEKNTTAFAEKYYEKGFLEHYLMDPAGNAEVEHTKNTRLITKLLSIEPLTREEETIEEEDYTIQYLRAVVKVEQFQPEAATDFLFQEGREYTLYYAVFFIEEKGRPHIAGFSYEIEEKEEPYLPLAEDARKELTGVTKETLALFYEYPAENMTPEKVWETYQQNCSETFLAENGITEESVKDWYQLLEENSATVTLTETAFFADGKVETYVIGGVTCEGYFVTAEYTYMMEGEAHFFLENDLLQTETKQQTFFLTKDKTGVFQIAAVF